MEDFLALMAACDAAVFLRWPTRRETSAAALRAMGLGIPVIISNLAHLRDIPDDSVVKIPVVDTESRLRQTLYELAENEPLREHLGATVKRYIAEHHSWEWVIPRWLEIITQAIELAGSTKTDRSFLPPHLRSEGIMT
jgi:glycosyltransferase involved in cell wall biosynthesis